MTATSGLPDRVRIQPSRLSGQVLVTGDKSIGHRCLLIGALADGPVAVEGLPPSADVAASAAALRALGVDVELSAAADGRLAGRVHGPVPRDAASDVVAIDCGNSGTTLRLVAGIAAGAGRHVVLDGDDSLRRRPVDRVTAPLAAMGVRSTASDDRLPPLEVLPGRVHDATWSSPVASAQIKSAILLAAVAGGVTATVRSPHASRDHTERMLRHGGIDVVSVGDADGTETVTVTPGTLSFISLHTPRDPSAAAFWHVAAACGSGTVVTPGLSLNPGRTGALDVLRAMGAAVAITEEHIVAGEPVGDVSVGPGRLTGAEVSGELVVRCLDELPVLAIAGAMSEDGLAVRDAAELRVKESDRISVLAETLGALGIIVETTADGFRVPGGQRPGQGHVEAHGDHRIAMTAAVAAALGTGPVTIGGFATVGSSYPQFLRDLEALGGRGEALDD